MTKNDHKFMGNTDHKFMAKKGCFFMIFFGIIKNHMFFGINLWKFIALIYDKK